jgi:hypothetical protein
LYINGVDYEVDNVLLDSGAIHKSYISEQFVNKYREILSEKIKKVNGNVKLADNITTKQITETVELELQITDARGNSQIAKVDMVVWEMPGTDVILGLSDLVDNFLKVFIEILQEEHNIRQELGAAPNMKQQLGKQSSEAGLIKPWSTGKEELSPEELDTPIPCAFTDAMYYMSKPHEEVVQDYIQMLPSHINQDWIHASDIMDRM